MMSVEDFPPRHPQGLERARRGAAFAPPPSAAPPARAITPAADRGGQEGRQGRLVHLGRPAARREDRQGVRSEVSRHRRARRAHRRRARVPAHRPGIRQPHLRGRRGQFVGCRALHRLEARRAGSRLRARGRRQVLSGRAQGPGRHVRELPRVAQRHRLQHQPREDGGRAEELRRPARSEMDRQDRQGASGLQRHDPDRDLPDAARSRLGAISRSSPSRTSCRCSRRPIRRRSLRSASAR